MQSMSMRIPQDVADKLSQLADATGRTKSYITIQALQEFLEREMWQINEIKQALIEADNGEFATDDEVASMHKKWGYSAD